MSGDLNQQNAAGGPPGGGYGGGGYAPPPGGGYGPPPGGAPPQGPPGGYGPPPGVPAQPTQSAVPPMPAGGAAKKTSVGLIIGLVVALFAVGGIAYGAYWYFGSSGPVLAKYAPKDTQIYVEIPSTTKALLQLAGTDIIDKGELEPEKKVDDVVDAFSSSFDLSKDEAKDIVTGVKGIAVVARDVKKKGNVAVIMSFSSSLEKLLKSKRFTKGDAMHGATTYDVERKDVDYDKLKKMSPYEQAFAGMQMKGDDTTVAWVDAKKLLVFGDKDMVEDTTRVINGDKDPLTTNETFKKAKFESGSVMIAYVDPEVVDDKDVTSGYLDGVGPFVGSMRFASAGMVTTIAGQFKGKKMPDDKSFTEAGKLTLSEKLPSDTIGYMAFSTKTKLSGKEAQDLFFKSMKDTDKEKGKAFQKQLDQVESDYGISLATMVDAIGDEGIFAITANEKLKLDKSDMPKIDDVIDNMGAVFAVQVKKKDAAEKLVKTLREEVVEKLGKDFVDVEKKDAGFVAKPKDDKYPTVKVLFSGDYLLFVVGKKEESKGIIDAFSGDAKSTLKDDKAHKKAMSALNTHPSFLMWIDTGRFLKQVLDDKDLKDMLKEKSIPYKALKVEGDDRMTSALAVEVKVSDQTWNYKVEGLNLAGTSALGGLAFLSRMSSSSSSFDPPHVVDPGGGGSPGGSVGVAECDQYISRMEACIPKMPAAAQSAMRDSLRTSHDMWAQMASNPSSKEGLKLSCQGALDAIAKMTMCN